VSATARVLVGGVGYRFTRDLAFGPLLIDRLRGAAWLDGIDLEDLSYAPVAIVQRWQDAPYDRLVLAGAVPRGTRPAGTLCRYCPTGVLPAAREIQDRVGEALAGTISLDNLLIIARAFGALPHAVEVIEVEPGDTGWGDELSPALERTMDDAVMMVRDAVGRGERSDGPAAVEALRQRDEILQVMYWLEGEGLAPDVRPVDLLPLLGMAEPQTAAQLDTLRRSGLVEQARNEPGRYRLSVIGRQEARRRFTEEFAPLLRRGHGECNDPYCDCHVTGDPAACLHRAAPDRR